MTRFILQYTFFKIIISMNICVRV